jgi:hypothetical protein
MRIFILSKDAEKVTQVEAELQKALGQIGDLHFQQIDPESTVFPLVFSDFVFIYPDEGKTVQINLAIEKGIFSMEVGVVKRIKKVPIDEDTTCAAP